ncbi:MAG TPA: hypothetical protein VGG97_18025 [Bryobacteraceae bacterium]|jgi:hypothetical protein
MRSRYITFCILIASACCQAQTPVAPVAAADPVGPNRGDTWSGYNIVNSFETGDRFLSVSGNEDKYRADENFGNGIRLLNSFFSMDSKNGHGRLFDQLVITTNGLGGDPYESVTLKVDKNKLYRYDFSWRKNDYFNPGLTTNGGQGQNLLNTTYNLQDHNLTLFPQSWIRFTLGYSRSSQSGAGLSTVQLYNASGPQDSTGDIFPVFTNVKRVQNDYRLGGELRFLGFTLNWMHGWEDFKDDTPFQFSGSEASPGPANNPLAGATLNSFQRAEANHGTSPYWQVGLFRDARWLHVNARFTHTAGVRDFVANETALGTNQFGALANQQILTAGDARRPVTTGNLNVTVQPTSKLTIASRTSIYDVRTEGNSAYLQYDNATQSSDLLYFQFLGIRTIETDADAQYQIRNWLDVHGGYTYSNRLISASPQFAFVGSTSGTPFRQTNTLNSGVFGFHLRPLKGLTVMADGEVGRTSNPFTPKSDQNYNTFSGRVQYKLRKLQLSATAKSDYNLNSVTLSSYSSHSRTYSGSAAWNYKSWLTLDASASKLHLDSLGGIAFFAGPEFLPNQLSYYVSNLYSATLDARVSVKRVDISLGYSRIQDLGDGRNSPTQTVIGPNLSAFQTAQTFPLKFQAPSARISVRIHERLRWNIGYQYFGYHETFSSGENYLAHTGYTSILWSF